MRQIALKPEMQGKSILVKFSPRFSLEKIPLLKFAIIQCAAPGLTPLDADELKWPSSLMRFDGDPTHLLKANRVEFGRLRTIDSVRLFQSRKDAFALYKDAAFKKARAVRPLEMYMVASECCDFRPVTVDVLGPVRPTGGDSTDRDDRYVAVRMRRAITDRGQRFKLGIVAARYMGQSVLGITEWPLIANYCGYAGTEGALTKDRRFDFASCNSFAIAHLYPSRAIALKMMAAQKKSKGPFTFMPAFR